MFLTGINKLGPPACDGASAESWAEVVCCSFEVESPSIATFTF